MELLDKYTFFYKGQNKKNMFAKLPFAYFEITSYPNTFAKTTLGFSVFTKIPFLLAL
jgi:hypothetical protein